MRRSNLILSAALLLAAIPASAQLTCTSSATQMLIRQEGLAERAGDIFIQCTGGAPAGPVNGSLNLFLNGPLANQTVNGSPDVELSVDAGGTWVPLPATVRTTSPGSLMLENINANLSATGTLGLRISNIRISGERVPTAAITWTGNPAWTLTSPLLVLGIPQRSLLAGGTTTLVFCNNPAIPENPTVNSLAALGVPYFTTRVTEAIPNTFAVRGSSETSGVRVLIRFPSLPQGTVFLTPDLIAGNTAVEPTSGGDMGLNVSGGVWSPSSQGSLLLGRVKGADPLGFGGTVPALPTTTPATLGSLSPADVAENGLFVVYETLNSNPAIAENAQIPIFIAAVTTSYDQSEPVQSIVTLGPLTPSLAVPVFEDVLANQDCQALGDCNAPYFPRIEIGDTPLTFTLPAGSNPKEAFFRLSNAGGGNLLWRSFVEYKSGNNWLSLPEFKGVNPRGYVRVFAIPKDLAEGTYEAQITITAQDPIQPVIVPVRLEVTAAVPTITAVNAPSERAFGQVAAGSLVVIRGHSFQQGSSVLVNATEAKVVAASTDAIYAQLPESLVGLASIRVRSGDRSSAPFQLRIASIAPSIIGSVNQNGTLNPTEGVAAGTVLQVFATGLAGSTGIVARIHDRWITMPSYAGAAPGMTGVQQVNLMVPADLQAMRTELILCGQNPLNAGEQVCSQAVPVQIR